MKKVILSVMLASQLAIPGGFAKAGGSDALSITTFLPLMPLLLTVNLAMGGGGIGFKNIVFNNASHGALKLSGVQTEQEAKEIIANDANLLSALAILQSEGFQGNILEAANYILEHQ